MNYFFLFRFKGFNLYPSFPAGVGEFPQGAVGPAPPEHQKLQLDPSASVKSEYMIFPPPLQRSPLNTSAERRYGKERGWVALFFLEYIWFLNSDMVVDVYFLL